MARTLRRRWARKEFWQKLGWVLIRRDRLVRAALVVPLARALETAPRVVAALEAVPAIQGQDPLAAAARALPRGSGRLAGLKQEVGSILVPLAAAALEAHHRQPVARSHPERPA